MLPMRCNAKHMPNETIIAEVFSPEGDSVNIFQRCCNGCELFGRSLFVDLTRSPDRPHLSVSHGKIFSSRSPSFPVMGSIISVILFPLKLVCVLLVATANILSRLLCLAVCLPGTALTVVVALFANAVGLVCLAPSYCFKGWKPFSKRSHPR